jgi:hypothetical protein
VRSFSLKHCERLAKPSDTLIAAYKTHRYLYLQVNKVWETYPNLRQGRFTCDAREKLRYISAYGFQASPDLRITVGVDRVDREGRKVPDSWYEGNRFSIQ